MWRVLISRAFLERVTLGCAHSVYGSLVWFSSGPWGQKGCSPAPWGLGTRAVSCLERAGGKGKMPVGMFFFQAYATNLRDSFLKYGERVAEKWNGTVWHCFLLRELYIKAPLRRGQHQTALEGGSLLPLEKYLSHLVRSRSGMVVAASLCPFPL